LQRDGVALLAGLAGFGLERLRLAQVLLGGFPVFLRGHLG